MTHSPSLALVEDPTAPPLLTRILVNHVHSTHILMLVMGHVLVYCIPRNIV